MSWDYKMAFSDEVDRLIEEEGLDDATAMTLAMEKVREDWASLVDAARDRAKEDRYYD